ncbi:hypothetical protein [Cytobacillus pseudoceanisediminis]|uniref:hypothetical protein n=1 Tax=Cytobacillus pseudoceanisediminis TaxID=3051614 RepID=UPI003C304EDD
MDYINPLFKHSSETIQPIPKPTKKKQSKKAPVRALRSDKTHNVKFPVSSIMQMKLKSLCRQAGRIYKEQRKVPLSQTKFNTILLRYGLQHSEIIDWTYEYSDTKVYMHTNILETEYMDIGGPYGFAVRKNLSERKVVFQIMNSVLRWLEGEGSLEKII